MPLIQVLSGDVLKQNDRLPYFRAILLNDDGSAVNLTGSLVRFFLLDVATGYLKVSSNMINEDAANGIVRYEWLASNTDIPGTFRGECEITFPDTRRLTVPDGGYVQIKILEDLGP